MRNINEDTITQAVLARLADVDRPALNISADTGVEKVETGSQP